MENNVSQIANNYITLPRTRIRRPKNRWAYIGAAAAICGILGVYGASKTNAQTLTTTKCNDIQQSMEFALRMYETDRHMADEAKSKALKESWLAISDKRLREAADWAVIYQAGCK